MAVLSVCLEHRNSVKSIFILYFPAATKTLSTHIYYAGTTSGNHSESALRFRYLVSLVLGLSIVHSYDIVLSSELDESKSLLLGERKNL